MNEDIFDDILCHYLEDDKDFYTKDDFYKDMMELYHDIGDDMIWDTDFNKTIKIGYMTDVEIRNTYNKLIGGEDIKSIPVRDVWIDIFIEEITKRRKRKIKKIKRKI